MKPYQLTGPQLSAHFRHMAMVYVVVVTAAIFLGGSVYAATRPEVPGDERLDIMIFAFAEEKPRLAWAEGIWPVMDERQREVNIIDVTMTGTANDALMLAARLASRDGDIYIVSQGVYDQLVVQGAFLEVSDIIAQNDLILGEGALLSKAHYGGNEELELPPGVYGIPTDGLQGMLEVGIVPDSSYICFTVFNDNMPNSIAAVKWILENKRELDLDIAQDAMPDHMR